MKHKMVRHPSLIGKLLRIEAAEQFHSISEYDLADIQNVHRIAEPKPAPAKSTKPAYNIDDESFWDLVDEEDEP